MSQISTSSEQSISHLQEIERTLAGAAVIDDLRTLKIRMSECLETVRTECMRQKQESTQALEALRGGLSQAAARESESLRPRDPLTGLSCRQDAETELRHAVSSGKRVFAAIFVVDRIPAITLRFGRPVGDKAMLVFFERLTSATGAEDRLFRWADTSFFAILERPHDLATTHRELNQHFLQKLNRAFELGSRSVLLPISASWVVVEASGVAASKVIADIDAFVKKTVVSV